MADYMFGDGLIVSVSQIKTYLRCPEQYRLRYVVGATPAFVPLALAFGVAFHASLGRYYLARKDGQPGLTAEELTQVFRDAFEAKRAGPIPLQGDNEDDEPKADPVDLAAKMLARFHLVASASPVDVQGVELPFKVSLHQPDTGELLEEELVGVIDLVARENRRLVVVEHKTSAKKYGADQLRYDFQPTAYQLALEQLGHESVDLRFQIITKTKAPQVQVEDVIRTQADANDFRRMTVGVLRAIDAQAFFPLRGWQCRTCPFKHACMGAPS